MSLEAVVYVHHGRVACHSPQVTIDLHVGSLSFSRNGSPLGVAFSGVKGPLVAAVTMGSEESKVRTASRARATQLADREAARSGSGVYQTACRGMPGFVRAMMLALLSSAAMVRRRLCARGWGVQVTIQNRPTVLNTGEYKGELR